MRLQFLSHHASWPKICVLSLAYASAMMFCPRQRPKSVGLSHLGLEPSEPRAKLKLPFPLLCVTVFYYRSRRLTNTLPDTQHTTVG